jgi:hypothetical protein
LHLLGPFLDISSRQQSFSQKQTVAPFARGQGHSLAQRLQGLGWRAEMDADSAQQSQRSRGGRGVLDRRQQHLFGSREPAGPVEQARIVDARVAAVLPGAAPERNGLLEMHLRLLRLIQADRAESRQPMCARRPGADNPSS